MNRSRVSTAAVLCAWLAGAPKLHAQPDLGFTIAVRAPEQAECSSAEQLTEGVEARAGRPARGEGGARLRVDVVIEPQGQAHRALVTVADASGRAQGQRELTAEGPCSALDEMLVLVIASSIGVSPGPAAVAPPPEPPAPELGPPAPEPEPAREPEPDTPSTPWRLDLDVSGRVLTGLLPDAAAAAGLGLFVEHGALGLRAAGAWLPAVTSRSEVALRITGGFGELALCGRAVNASRLAVLFCAGVQGGALHAEAGGLWQETPRWDAVLQLAPSASARLRLLPWAGLALGLGTTIPLVFPRYFYVSASGGDLRLHAIEVGVFAELALWIRLNP